MEKPTTSWLLTTTYFHPYVITCDTDVKWQAIQLAALCRVNLQISGERCINTSLLFQDIAIEMNWCFIFVIVQTKPTAETVTFDYYDFRISIILLYNYF